MKRILVISLTNLGDVILTTPVMSALRKRFPEAFISVLIGPKAEMLLKGSETINRVVIYNKKFLSWAEKWKMVLKLKEEKFDLVVDLRNTAIPLIIQAKTWEGIRLFPSREIQMRKRHLERLQFLNILDDQNHFNFFSELEKKSAAEKLKQNGIDFEKSYVAIAPGAGSYLKRWNVERFGEVLRMLKAKNKQVVIVGSEAEKELGEKIKSQSTQNIFNSCGLLTLRELAALIRYAALVIACDSAIMHLANEQDVPVVSIFGPTDDQKYARFSPKTRIIRRSLDCSPCERAHCKFERQHCMEDILAEDVFRASWELLSATH